MMNDINKLVDLCYITTVQKEKEKGLQNKLDVPLIQYTDSLNFINELNYEDIMDSIRLAKEDIDTLNKLIVVQEDGAYINKWTVAYFFAIAIFRDLQNEVDDEKFLFRNCLNQVLEIGEKIYPSIAEKVLEENKIEERES